MAILPSIRQLLIPGKSSKKAHPEYKTDMQQLEIWGRQPIQKLVAGSGVTLSPSSGLATDSKGNGPFPITISASGGSGVTSLTSPHASITITNPSGPTVSVDIEGWPFPPFQDANANVGYGPNLFAHDTTGGSNSAFGNGAIGTVTTGNNNAGFGFAALANVTTGSQNTGIGTDAGESITTGSDNTAVGYQSLKVFNGTFSTAIGMVAGQSCSGGNGNTFLGANTDVGAAGSARGRVAIGADHLSVGAKAFNDDDFVLGTNNHVIVFNNNVTGAGTTGVGGANNPAATPGSIQGWIPIRDTSGTIGYIPFWR